MYLSIYLLVLGMLSILLWLINGIIHVLNLENDFVVHFLHQSSCHQHSNQLPTKESLIRKKVFVFLDRPSLITKQYYKSRFIFQVLSQELHSPGIETHFFSDQIQHNKLIVQLDYNCCLSSKNSAHNFIIRRKNRISTQPPSKHTRLQSQSKSEIA